MFLKRSRSAAAASVATATRRYLATSSSFSPRESTIMLGCVAYCDAITSIWEGMRRYFVKKNVAFDVVLFTSYERQIEALLRGHIDVAWNGPLAHARLQRLAGAANVVSLGMRDVDRDFVSYLVTTKNAEIRTWGDLRGCRLATGAYDSPQAYVVPMHHLLSTVSTDVAASIDVTRFDKDVGKHGDTALGEIDVIHALRTGAADAGFVSQLMLDRRDKSAAGDERLSPHVLAVPTFDHCQFDAVRSTFSTAKQASFQAALLSMSWQCAEEREVMKLEGIRRTWEGPRESGYDVLRSAIEDEEVAVAPAPLHTVDRHPFRSLGPSRPAPISYNKAPLSIPLAGSLTNSPWIATHSGPSRPAPM